MNIRKTGEPELEDLDDAALIARALQPDEAAFCLIMKRHNQRLHRVARAVLDDETEAEDVVQETYFHAFKHLSEFRSEARLSTWLTRITLNEALGRRRRRRPTIDIEAVDPMPPQPDTRKLDPEEATAVAEIRRLLERALNDLPEPFRVVFVMRDVEEMSTEETALLLGLQPETVRTRLHRARRLLRKALQDKFAAVLTDIFPFAGSLCERLTRSVLDRLALRLERMPAR